MQSLQQVSQDVILEKYAKGTEKTEDDIFKRVAKGIASVEKTPELRKLWEGIFYENMKAGAIGAGRIMSAAGTDIKATLNNCYVIPVGDCIQGVDDGGYPGIYDALKQAAETMRRGGGVGYDFSRIRPKNAYVKGTHSFASGPCSYMDVFDKSCTTVESAGCFTGDTLVHTTEGLFPIKEIVESNKDFYAVTHLGPKKITAKFNNGVKPVYRMMNEFGLTADLTLAQKIAQFKDGQIVTVPFGDVMHGNRKAISLTLNSFDIDVDWTDKEKFAYLVGAFQANGTYINYEKVDKSEKYPKGISFSYNTTKQEIVNRVEKFLNDLGFNAKVSKRPNENTLEIKAYDVNKSKEFFDICGTKGVDMVIPDHILKNTNSIWCAYIAGLLDADGHFTNIKSNIHISLISKKLLKQLCVVFYSLGIPVSYRIEREAVGNWKELYQVGVYGKTAQIRFNRTVGKFCIQQLTEIASRDRSGYGHYWEDVKGYGYSKYCFESYWSCDENKHPKISLNAITNCTDIPDLVNTTSSNIISSSLINEQVVYDLEVEDVHMFSANGFYVSNSRRGAQMGVLRIDHPDIMEFITAKRTVGRWNNFNVSVMVSDEFMKAVEQDLEWKLVHIAKPAQSLIDSGAYSYTTDDRNNVLWVYSVVKAKKLWDSIMQSAYDFAEPGILFHDNMNKDNNLRYVEKLNATNPCAEQPLPNYGCCDLGPIILTKLVKYPFTERAQFDFGELKKLTATHVRFLDNVLDATYWPLPEQDEESKNKRRIGIEFTGLGDSLIMLGLKYNSDEGYSMGALIAETMRDAAYEASVELAKEKGVFPLFDAKKYLEEGTFASRLPKELKKKIAKFGIRNSHLLSTGPTGTVSLAFGDNCSNGIEPPFSWSYIRKKRNGDGTHTEYEVMDHAYRMYKEMGNDVTKLPDYFVSAMDMTASDHIKMLEVVQPFVDSSISKTVNVPVDYPFEDFKGMYMQAWKANLKGLATYRPNSIIGSVLSIKEEPKASEIKTVSSDIDYNKVVIEKRPVGMLDSVSEKIEYWSTEGKKSVYMSVSFMPMLNDAGQVACIRPIEFFIPVGQHGESQQWLQTCMRMLSLAARGGFLDKALADMRKVAWDRGPIRHGFKTKEDGTKVPLYHDSEVAVLAWAIQNIIDTKSGVITTEVTSEIGEVQAPPPGSGKKCPECGAHSVIKKDGCSFCESCGAIGSCG